MARSSLTLYLNDAGLRLLVSSGSVVKKWAVASLEPGLVKGAVVQDAAAVSAKVAGLMAELGISGGKVQICLSGLNTLSRPLSVPKVSRSILPEVVLSEARQALPVPLEEYYLSWQTVPTAAADKIGAFVTAIPRQATDLLLAAVKQAGLTPYYLDVKTLALARLAPEATAIIVDVQPTEFDIIVKSGGIPHPVRTVPLTEESLSLSGKLPLVRDDVLRAIQFHNDNNPERMLPREVPFYVSGELAQQPELLDGLAEEFGYRLAVLPSPLEGPPEFVPGDYMGNIGLAARELSAASGKTAPVNLNVLPSAYRPQPISIARVLALPVVVAAVALLGFMAVQYFNLADAITTMQTQLDSTNQLLLDRKIEAQGLRQDVSATVAEQAAVAAETEAIRSLAVSLVQHHTLANNQLGFSVDFLPADVYLENISYNDGDLILKGWGEKEDTILYYGKLLDGAVKNSEVIVSHLIRRVSDGVVLDSFNFDLLLRERD